VFKGFGSTTSDIEQIRNRGKKVYQQLLIMKKMILCLKQNNVIFEVISN